MKLKTLNLFLFSILLQFTCLGQDKLNQYASLEDWNTDTLQLHKMLNNYLEGGSEKFYVTLYENIKYPSIAHKNCKEGLALIQVSVVNKIQTIKILNKTGIEFDKEILKAFNKLEEFWKPLENKIDFQISFRFSINSYKENIKKESATIEIKLYSMGGLNCDSICDYRTTEFLNEKVKYAMEYKDYESSALLLKELMRRFPFNKQYQKLYKKAWGNIEK